MHSVAAFLAITFGVVEAGAQDAATVPVLPPPPAVIPAFVENEDAPLYITEIRIEGLKKTRGSYMQTVLKKYTHIPIDKLDLHAVETTLQAEGIFESVEVELISGENPLLHITVKEKLSFIPLPFGASSNGSAMGGLIVLDTNAFGVKDMYMVGGIFSKNSLMGMTNFSKPSIARTKPGFTVGGSASKNTATFTDLAEDDVLVYDAVGCNVHAAITDRVSEHSQASLGIAYSQSAVENAESKNGYTTTADSYKAIAFTASWGMAMQDWNGWFMSNKNISLSGNLRVYDDETVSPSTAARLVIEQPLLSPRLRFTSQVSGAYWRKDHISQLGDGGAVGVSILPDDFHSSKLAGSYAGFEYAFAKARWAMFSVYANYQAALCEDADAAMRFTHGPASGARMYLTKIAFPALAFGFSYNVPLKMPKYSVAFGVGM